MLSTIKDVILGIYHAIISIFDFLGSAIRELATIARLCAQSVAAIPSYLGFLPASAIAIVLLLVSVAVLYKITGREG